jgi:hypothetical protein
MPHIDKPLKMNDLIGFLNLGVESVPQRRGANQSLRCTSQILSALDGKAYRHHAICTDLVLFLHYELTEFAKVYHQNTCRRKCFDEKLILKEDVS